MSIVILCFTSPPYTYEYCYSVFYQSSIHLWVLLFCVSPVFHTLMSIVIPCFTSHPYTYEYCYSVFYQSSIHLWVLLFCVSPVFHTLMSIVILCFTRPPYTYECCYSVFHQSSIHLWVLLFCVLPGLHTLMSIVILCFTSPPYTYECCYSVFHQSSIHLWVLLFRVLPGLHTLMSIVILCFTRPPFTYKYCYSVFYQAAIHLCVLLFCVLPGRHTLMSMTMGMVEVLAMDLLDLTTPGDLNVRERSTACSLQLNVIGCITRWTWRKTPSLESHRWASMTFLWQCILTLMPQELTEVQPSFLGTGNFSWGEINTHLSDCHTALQSQNAGALDMWICYFLNLIFIISFKIDTNCAQYPPFTYMNEEICKILEVYILA